MSSGASSAGEERLQRMLQVAGVIAFEWNVATGELAWPETQLEVLGLTPAQFDRRFESLRQRVHPDDLPAVEARLAAARERRDGYRDEFRIRRPDGSVRWLAVTGEFEVDGATAPQRMRGLAVDVTSRKSTDRALQEAVEFNRQLVSSAQEGIVVFDREQRYVLYNPFMERLRGLRAAEVLGRRPRDVLPAAYAAEVEERNRRVLTGETVYVSELGASRSDRGEELWLSLIASPLRDASGNIVGVLAMLRDVTALKRATDAVRENEERLRQVTENIGEVFWLTDVAKRTVVYISPAYEKIWGRSCESLIAAPQSWLEAIHSDDRERIRAAAHTQQAGGQYDVEYRVLRPDGTERWVHDRAFPIRDAQGRIYRIAGVAEDVTRARVLEERYRQAQKMEAVGQLAGGIAHDFNNLLTVIQMQGSLLLRQADAYVSEGLGPIMEAAERAANLTRQLLTFSRRQKKESRAVDLSSVIRVMVQLLRRVLGEDIGLETRIAPNVPLVNADTGMIEQVVMNLAVNARDAMLGGGRLTIGLEAISIGEEYLTLHPEARRGNYVRLTITDTGCGISREHLPHIFEPFFTTKEVGKGTGLGLATVFGIVEQHGGWIDVDSEVGQGTSFHVFFPALREGTPAAETGGEPIRRTRGGSERILLVEDEAPVRDVTRMVLRRLGYQVLEASSAREALAKWENSSEPLDLLITDLIMPGGMTGHQLALKLREKRPDLRVIYMSGYSDEIVNRTIEIEPGADFLSKPFEVDALATIVRQALDQPPRKTGPR